jgi:glycine dehydrogenase subunit 1
MALLGEEGFTGLARLNHARAAQLADRLARVPGVGVVNDTFFNEFTLRLPKPAAPVVDALARRGVLGGVPLSRLYPGRPDLASLLLVAATETNTDEDVETFAAALTEVLS